MKGKRERKGPPEADGMKGEKRRDET